MPIVLGSKFGHVPTYPAPKIITGPRASRYAAGDTRPDLVPQHQQSQAEHAAALEAQRNADMVNRHMQMQQFDLSMAERKRFQKLSNGMAAIDQAEKDGTLDPIQANHLRFQIKTDIDPMKLKMAQAQVAHMNMQTEMISKQAEAQALANANHKAIMAKYGQNGVARITHADGSVGDYGFDQHGKMHALEGTAKKKELAADVARKQAEALALGEMPGHFNKDYKPALDANGKPKAGETYDRVQNDLKRDFNEKATKHFNRLMGIPEEPKETQAGPFGGSMSQFVEQYPQAMRGAAQGAQQPAGEMPQAGAPAQPPQNAPPTATPDFNQARTRAAQAMTGTQMIQAATGGQSPELDAINTVESFMRDYKNLSQLSPEQQQQYQQARQIAAPFFAAPGG